MPNGYDKNWVRFCGAIDGFKVRFGHWPSRILLQKDILGDLEQRVFTPESMARIKEKVSLIVEDVDMIAQDKFGNQYSYGDEGFPKRRPKFDAQQWFGVEPDRPDPDCEE